MVATERTAYIEGERRHLLNLRRDNCITCPDAGPCSMPGCVVAQLIAESERRIAELVALA